MVNLGRPVSLNRKNVSEACMHIYWKEGINNISYNDVIKISKLSKGSFYKLFYNEDDLQAETLKIYNADVTQLFQKLEASQDLFQMLLVLKDWKFNNNLKYCYFFISYLDKYRMGKKTKNVITKIEEKYKLLLDKISRKHIKKYNIKNNSMKINQLVSFVFNSISLISLLHRNKSPEANINLYKDSLFQFVSKLHK